MLLGAAGGEVAPAEGGGGVEQALHLGAEPPAETRERVLLPARRRTARTVSPSSPSVMAREPCRATFSVKTGTKPRGAGW
ncbi:hypothetical protein GCM10010440_15090 [Kitasatospora cinereorecta]